MFQSPERSDWFIDENYRSIESIADAVTYGISGSSWQVFANMHDCLSEVNTVGNGIGEVSDVIVLDFSTLNGVPVNEGYNDVFANLMGCDSVSSLQETLQSPYEIKIPRIILWSGDHHSELSKVFPLANSVLTKGNDDASHQIKLRIQREPLDFDEKSILLQRILSLGTQSLYHWDNCGRDNTPE